MEKEKGNRRPIFSSTYGFSEDDVAKCTDLQELRRNYDGVAMDVSVMEDKINNSRNQDQRDEDWHRKIQSALKSQYFLMDCVKNRIIQLKNDPPEFCYIEMRFVEEAERVLDEETFKKIQKGAEKRIIED